MKKIYLLLFFCILCVCPGCKKIAAEVEEFLLEATARGLVSGLANSECAKVEITEKISDGRWSADAYFANGQKRKCIIFYPDGTGESGEVFVILGF